MQEAGGPARRQKNGQRYRRICFTLNNWTPQEYNDLCAFKATWMIIGKEVGDNGTPHLQGAAILGSQMTLATLKKVPGFRRAHIENMYGSPEKNEAYCSKQDPSPFVKGTLPKPGRRNDLESAYASLAGGATMRQMAEEHGVEVIKYHKGLIAVRSLLVEARTEAPKVVWLFGPTGIGKSRVTIEFATKHFGGDYWMSCGSLQWFDGYDGQNVAILDDFRGKHCPFSVLLRLLDRYSFRVPYKGGFVEWNPKVIFITCPYSPNEIFDVRGKHLPEDIKQLERRITQVVHWKDEGFSFASVMTALEDIILPKPAQVINLEEENSDLEILGDEVAATQPYESEEEGDSFIEFLKKQ